MFLIYLYILTKNQLVTFLFETLGLMRLRTMDVIWYILYSGLKILNFLLGPYK